MIDEGSIYRWACGLHTASFVSRRPNETVCGMHTTSLPFGRFNEPVCGVHTASLASSFPWHFPLPLLFLLIPTYPPRHLSPGDMAFNGGVCCGDVAGMVGSDMAWRGRQQCRVMWREGFSKAVMWQMTIAHIPRGGEGW